MEEVPTEAWMPQAQEGYNAALVDTFFLSLIQ